MLKSILNDAQLSSKTSFSIVLLPPIANSIEFSSPCCKSYLESHVIHVPWGSTLTNSTNSRLKLIKKIIQIDQDKYAQLMLSVNDTMFETSSGYISCNNKRKAKIIHSQLLYTLPGNPTCTHLLLYMDQPIIDFVSTGNPPLMQRQQQGHLSFKEMIPANNSNDVIHKIDLLALKFCDTSIYCDSLESLHDCMDEILYEGYRLIESLDSNAMANVSTLLNMDNLCGAFESYFMDLTYDVAFFKITQLLLPQDKITTLALQDMEHLDFSQIALPSSILDPRIRVLNAITSFERIGSFRTPAEKLECLLMTVSELTQDSDSDSLIPLFLMTLIRSKVPHLSANLSYMKDYTFERNIKTGKYGYALSTFEGVLEYILNAHPYLSSLSKQNVAFWTSIKTGDIEQFRHEMMMHKDDNEDDFAEVHDIDGNNALMIACLYGQAEIAAEILIRQQKQLVTTNDQNKTPLMAAIQSRSIDTIHMLLKHSATVEASLDTVDCFGNTAALYACSTNDVNILRAVVMQYSHTRLLDQVNRQTGDTSLHVAARHGGGSMDVIMFILQHVANPNMIRKKNDKGETFFHVCGNLEYIKHALAQDPSMIHVVGNQVDQRGQTPCMTWAANGRLDLVETVLRYGTHNFARVDKDGRTLLHLMAMCLGRHVVFGHHHNLDDMIQKMRRVVNVRDWCHGNTALHMAAETSMLASTHNVASARAFIQALVKHGAALDAVNLRDEQPVHVCRIPELIACLDELHLKTESSYYSSMTHHQYTWAVTRPLIQQHNGSHVSYFIKSGQRDKPHTMRLVNRKLQDFSFLRKELLYEMPELFLPTFNGLCNPSTIDLRPPPFALVEATLMTLQSFMDWLQYHPILQNHDLVMTFVRSSSSDLQKSTMRDNSFSRRKLMLEKIKDMPLGNTSTMMSSKDEAYFLTYAQEAMVPLKAYFLNVLLTARKLQHTGLELERNMMLVGQDALAASTCSEASEMFACNTVAIETIQMCANVTFEKSYVSPWLGLIQANQMAYGMIDGILLSLQRPFDLIHQRCALRETIELQKEMLRSKSTSWHNLFSAKERKKRMEESKEKVIHNMNKLNDMDGQMNQAHRLISDELAHFQTVHPKKMVKTLKRFATSTLAMERHKLSVLEQALETWEQKPLPPLP